jgi:hypothetical protein
MPEQKCASPKFLGGLTVFWKIEQSAEAMQMIGIKKELNGAYECKMER